MKNEVNNMENGKKEIRICRSSSVYKSIQRLGYRVADDFVKSMADMLDKQNKKTIKELCRKAYTYTKNSERKNLKLRDLEAALDFEPA